MGNYVVKKLAVIFVSMLPNYMHPSSEYRENFSIFYS
jgi:hypothetical protein